MARFQVTFDCADPDRQAEFWSGALGYRVQPPPQGYDSWEAWLREHGMEDRAGTASAIVDEGGILPRIFFQRVPEPKTSKNRVHLDLNVPRAGGLSAADARRLVEQESQRLEELGANRIRAVDQDSEFWIVMTDPEGNEFCVQ